MMLALPSTKMFASARQIGLMSAKLQVLGKRLLTLAQISAADARAKLIQIDQSSPLVYLRVCW
jgi:hypothetical protein